VHEKQEVIKTVLDSEMPLDGILEVNKEVVMEQN
jgi:hypothetical protein